MTESCVCEQHGPVPISEVLGVFERVRPRCPALKELLVPDDVWPTFQAWHQRNLYDVPHENLDAHVSMLLHALSGGYLSRLTTPIHRFLMDQQRVRADLVAKYRNNLSERWYDHREDGVGRHQKFREYFGKFAELQLAEWLHGRGWTVVGLEATGARHDVEAQSPGGRLTHFEVKYLGVTDDEFQSVAAAIRDQDAGHCVSPYQMINYLLFRLLEAADQLKESASDRVAVAVIDPEMWCYVEIQLKNRWVDWSNPEFVKPVAEAFLFLDREREKDPTLDQRLGPTLRSLSAIWIMKGSSTLRRVVPTDDQPDA